MTKRTIVLLALSNMFLAAQEPKATAPVTKPAIEITSVPPADAGGPDKLGTIAGRVIGECLDCVVILFAKAGPDWWVQPRGRRVPDADIRKPDVPERDPPGILVRRGAGQAGLGAGSSVAHAAGCWKGCAGGGDGGRHAGKR